MTRKRTNHIPALELIQQRGKQGTTLRDVAKHLKDDINTIRSAVEYLVDQGQVYKKPERIKIRGLQRVKTQKVNVYYPVEVTK